MWSSPMSIMSNCATCQMKLRTFWEYVLQKGCQNKSLYICTMGFRILSHSPEVEKGIRLIVADQDPQHRHHHWGLSFQYRCNLKTNRLTQAPYWSLLWILMLLMWANLYTHHQFKSCNNNSFVIVAKHEFREFQIAK